MRVGTGLIILFMSVAAPAVAQEDIEPRIVGAAGVNSLGISGFIDTFASSESTFPLHASMHVDVSRFLTDRIAVRGGLIGSTTFRDDGDEVTSGPAAASLHALVSGLYYFTPRSLLSLYTGVEYRAQLMRRAEQDSGTALGLGGLQATISSRASMFIQGGYGARLTRGDDGELQTRLTGEIGVRITF
ncbi:MAG: hypothetical protein ACRD1W_17285 [Vicinamibacterales bacterium]